MKKIAIALVLAAAPAFATLYDTSDGRQSSIANGVTTAYTFFFPTGAATDIVATVTVAGIVQSNPYTAVINSDQISSPGGTVTFTTAPVAGATVKIQRNELLTQSTVYAPFSLFPAKTTEKTFDSTVRKIQQVDRRVADLETKEVADIASVVAGGVGTASSISPLAADTTTALPLSAWLSVPLRVESFGALGDGSTDNCAFITTAIATAMSKGKALAFGPGQFNTSCGFIMNQPIRIFGQGRATTIKMTGIATSSVLFYLGCSVPNGHPYADYAAGTVFNFTGALTAGQKILTGFGSTTGLVVGDEIFLSLGEDPSDPGQQFLRYWTRVEALTSNTVTVRVPVPEAVSGTFTGTYPWAAATHKLAKFTNKCEGFELGNFAIDGTPGSADVTIFASRTRQVYIHDLMLRNVQAGIVVDESENAVVERVYFNRSLLSGLSLFGNRNFVARDLVFKEVDQNNVDLETQNRGVLIENALIDMGPGKLTTNVIFVGGGSKGVHFRNFSMHGQAGLGPYIAFGVLQGAVNGGYENVGDVITEDFYLTGTGIDTFNTRFHTGFLYWQGVAYRHLKRFRYAITLQPSMTNVQFTMPSGLYKSFRASVGSKTGLNLIQFKTAVGANNTTIYDSGNSIDNLPAAGTFGSLLENAFSPWQLGPSYLFSLTPTGKFLNISTTGAMPANTPLIVDVEVFQPTDDDGVSGRGFDGDLTVANLVPTTISPPATSFANLGTPANGRILYCSDCTIANPCAGGGTGAIAKRLNGVWVCN